MRNLQTPYLQSFSGCKYGIHIAVDNDEVGLFANYDLLESQHDTAGLLGVRAGELDQPNSRPRSIHNHASPKGHRCGLPNPAPVVGNGGR